VSETPPESFDLEIFRTELAEATEAYGNAKSALRKTPRHFTEPLSAEEEGRNSALDAKEAELYSGLLDMCASALRETQGDPKTMEVIDSTLISYATGQPPYRHQLFDSRSDNRERFYRELAMRVAKD